MCFLTEYSEEDDLNVEQGRPVFHIPKVVSSTVVALFFGIGGASPSIHLCPTGNARLEVMTDHVVINFALHHFIEEDTVGAGAYHAHIAQQYIDELRQLVEAVFAYKAADAGYTGIVFWW